MVVRILNNLQIFETLWTSCANFVAQTLFGVHKLTKKVLCFVCVSKVGQGDITNFPNFPFPDGIHIMI